MKKHVWRLAIPAMALAYLWPVVAQPGGVLFPPRSDHTDLLVTHWPDALWFRRAVIQRHELPLWNPAILGGQPFAADPLAGVWYPPNWIMLVPGLPLAVAFNVLFVGHLMLGGWGMYHFLLSAVLPDEAVAGANLGRGAALVGAAAFMGMPMWAAHLGAGHVSLYYAVAWTPWVLAGIRRMAPGGSSRAAALGGATLAVTFLADVRWALYAGLLAGAYWIWLIIAAGRWQTGSLSSKATRNAAPTAAVFLVFFLALTAVLALPFLEFRSLTARAGLTLMEAATMSLPLRYLVGAVLPDLGGFYEWMTYLGFLPVALAASAILLRHRPGQWPFWLGTALAAALMSLGANTPLFGLLLRLIPFLGWLRVPARAWFLVGLALAVLAAVGAHALAGGVSGRAARVYRLAAVGGATLTCGLAVGSWVVVGRPISSLLALAAASTLGLAFLVLATSKRVSATLVLSLAVLITMADLGFVDSTLMRVQPVEAAFAAGRGVAGAISDVARAEQVDAFRVYSPSYSLPQHVAAALGLEQADGVNPLQLASTVAFMTRATGVPSKGYGVTLPPFATGNLASDNAQYVPDARLLGLLAVRYVASEFDIRSAGLRPIGRFGATRLYENLQVYPYAWVATRIEAAPRSSEALDLAARGIAAVEGASGLDGAGRMAPAQVLARGINFLTVSTQSDEPGLLVVAEIDYPGWQARVDGLPASIVRTDGLLRGVFVSAGRHVVDFRFAPRSVLFGAAVTGLGLLALVVILAWPALRRNRVAAA